MLATLKRAASELSSSQKKLFKIDDNVGIAISGLTADGTRETKALRNDCITHKFTFESDVDVGRLAARVADKSQARSLLTTTILHELFALHKLLYERAFHHPHAGFYATLRCEAIRSRHAHSGNR